MDLIKSKSKKKKIFVYKSLLFYEILRESVPKKVHWPRSDIVF